MTVRAVLFDFDGTLADTFSLAMPALNQAAPKFGLQVVPETRFDALRRLPPRELFKELNVPMWKLPLILHEVRRTLAARQEEINIFPGVAQALHVLRQQGLRLGIVSSNARSTIQHFLNRNGLATTFEIVYTSLALLGKHRRLHDALLKLRCDTGSAIYVGDEVRDIEAARRAHVRVIACAWGYSHPSALLTAAPDALIHTAHDLTSTIEQFT